MGKKFWERFMEFMIGTKNVLGFILTLLCILITGYVAIFQKPDLVSELPFILGVYLGARTLERGSHVWASTKDEGVNTQEVIKELNKE
jgi:hypothetical protein